MKLFRLFYTIQLSMKDTNKSNNEDSISERCHCYLFPVLHGKIRCEAKLKLNRSFHHGLNAFLPVTLPPGVCNARSHGMNVIKKFPCHPFARPASLIVVLLPCFKILCYSELVFLNAELWLAVRTWCMFKTWIPPEKAVFRKYLHADWTPLLPSWPAFVDDRHSGVFPSWSPKTGWNISWPAFVDDRHSVVLPSWSPKTGWNM